MLGALSFALVGGLIATPRAVTLPSPANATEYTAALLALAGTNTANVSARPGPAARAFTCPPMAPSPTTPTSVHALRPADIGVVGALGDSITAGFGARASSLIDLAVESRGVSWSIGGDEGAVTLPNFLKVYNPNIKGFSLAAGNAGRGFGDASISGAVSPGMLGQATTMVRNMQASLSAQEFSQDWKFVTLWIGGNDMCSRATSAAEYASGIEAALDYLQANLPRTFVNLVTMVDVGKLYDITGADIGCSLVRPVVCSRGSDRERSAREATAYQAQITRLSMLPKYRSETFTVVDQPWYTNFQVLGTVIDRSYLSPDCFHFAVPGHQFSAFATWNNLFQATADKQLDYTVGEDVVCPSDAAPLLCTLVNDCTV